MNLKKILLKYFIFSTFFCVLTIAIMSPAMASDPTGAIRTGDAQNLSAKLLDTAKSLGSWATTWAKDEWKWLRDEGIALAYKKALSYYLSQLAHDAAVYLVTGDKGQSTMFYTESWGDYLGNLADNAAGHFLERLGQGNGILAEFDLCDPGLDVTLKIGYGLLQAEDPDEPDCTYSEMKNNWESELKRKDFLDRFSAVFEPNQNDFGIALSLKGKLMQTKLEATEAGKIVRETNDGFKDVTDKISEAIKTPAGSVKSWANTTFAEKSEVYYRFTGHAVADAIQAFTSTLASTLMKELFTKGLSRSSENTSYTGNWGGFTSDFGGSGGSGYGGSGGLTTASYNRDPGSGIGIAVVNEQFSGITAPNFSVGGDYDALAELAICGNPTNAKTNECVMTETFRQAVENRMTVAEAMTKRYINKDGVFGFKADGLEPNFNEGFPYRSMIIMRKYRIVPVGWELAAQYIMDHQEDLHRSFSLYDMIACFEVGTGDRYQGYDEEWCRGLVDPTWVFKAPQNFCKREGPGPHIVSSRVSGKKEKSKLHITRDDSYCADEQTCIRENDDGTCEIYGYCTEDRRKYNFGGESCEPIYNTCQSFRAEDGRTIALLKNTLDYGTSDLSCNAENAGCRKYSRAVNPRTDGVSANYNTQQDFVNWSQMTSSIRLDYSAKECEEESEGCHEFIRTRSGIGANLLKNASFEEYNGTEFPSWGAATRITENVYQGLSAMQVPTTGVIGQSIDIDAYDVNNNSTNFNLAGEMFTLSLHVRDCNVGNITLAGIGEDNNLVTDDTDDNAWKFVVVSHAFPETETGHTVNINITEAANCIIDGVKLERNDPGSDGRPTRFTRYREAALVYQKLIPAYLFESCYEENPNNPGFMELKSDAPESCSDYARYCTASEVNCELYESMTDDFSVPAAVTALDYCPEECVGYDEYQQTLTNFEDTETEYFIPDTADVCSALVAGCDEFTNLDEMNDPEAREYFVHMRQCINPDDDAAECRPFFMWEGSDETGYQLRVHQLDTENGGNIRRALNLSCSTILGESGYSADCREFYDAIGTVDYQLYYNTISCTDDCHPYRRTIAVDATNCTSHNGTWQDGYCIYMGVPSEGITCDAEEAGCREYNGNSGANTRIVFEQSFENGTSQGWDGGVNNTASVIVGEHSLAIDSSARLELGANLVENKSYVLQFLAVGTIGVNINNISFGSGGNTRLFDEFNTENDNSDNWDLALQDTWRDYEVSLDSLNHEIDVDEVGGVESLIINVSGAVNIDNIRLTEVTDRHYLIEESWKDNCEYIDADPDGTTWTVYSGIDDDGHYAGCDAYLDRDNIQHNLFQFTHLCSDSAVGCELMIDTHNYADYRDHTWDNDTPDEYTVDADSYVYAVYDRDKSCEVQDKGCERIGLEYVYEYPDGDAYQYFDNYKLNNPDLYNESLCRTEEINCDAWESVNGNSYFKDPQDMVCEWRIQDEEGINQWKWLKKEVKRCDVTDYTLTGSANGKIDVPHIDNNSDGNISSDERSAVQPVVSPIFREINLCSTASDCQIQGSIATWCDSDADCDIFGVGTCVDNECRNSCILDTHDYLCGVDNNGTIAPKTIGHGGPGAKVEQPLGDLEGSNWVATCPANQDDCSEFIDPESTASFDIDMLEPYTLYILDNRSGNSIPSATSIKLKTINGNKAINILLLEISTIGYDILFIKLITSVTPT